LITDWLFDKSIVWYWCSLYCMCAYCWCSDGGCQFYNS